MNLPLPRRSLLRYALALLLLFTSAQLLSGRWSVGSGYTSSSGGGGSLAGTVDEAGILGADLEDVGVAREVCGRYGWEPYAAAGTEERGVEGKGGRRRKIYDLCMVNSELDFLEIRINTTWEHVDYFVIVESRRTFTGHSKPLTIKDALSSSSSSSALSRYASKIIHHELQYPPSWNPERLWDAEDLQRNAMYTQVLPALTGEQAPAADDVLVVADVDEIPRPATLALLRACAFPRRLTLRSRFFYYGFQWLHTGPEWPHPQATVYRPPPSPSDGADGDADSADDTTILPVPLRNNEGPWLSFFARRRETAALGNAAWHCSSCFATIREFTDKTASFSHEWMNQEWFRWPPNIVEAVRGGKDLWGREGDKFVRVGEGGKGGESEERGELDAPPFVLAERERFGYLLERTGPRAGFTDYDPKVYENARGRPEKEGEKEARKGS